MKLAFSGQGRYADFDGGYALYLKRNKSQKPLDEKEYHRVVRAYCKMMAERLHDEGIVDLPNKNGSIMAVRITRKPQYRGKQFIGYGAMDWKAGHFDGKLKTFGLVYMPRRDTTQNMRALGFVANRRLFKKIKERYISGESEWGLMDFNDDMV